MKQLNSLSYVYEVEAISEILVEEKNEVLGTDDEYGYVKSKVLVDFSMVSSLSMAKITEEGKERNIADIYLAGVMYTLNEDYDEVVNAFIDSRSSHQIVIN